MQNETMQLWPQIEGMPVQIKIPLVDLALPALHRLSPQQFEQFRAAITALAINQDDLFAYMLQKIVTRHLEAQFLPARKPLTQFYALRGLARDCGVLLSATAYAGQKDAGQARRAFDEGAQLLAPAAGCEIPWLPPDECGLSNLDSALERLGQAVPQIKKNVLNACAQTVAADEMVQEPEAELLRAIADSLDCPIPPFALPPQEITGLTV
jgi:hypothetical protein